MATPLPSLALPIGLDKYHGELATEPQFPPRGRCAYIEPKPNSASSAINIFHCIRFCRSIPQLPSSTRLFNSLESGGLHR